MALFETARTGVEVVHKEDDRQRLKHLDVALRIMAAQATRKLRLAAGKFGKALAWFERGATTGKLTTHAQLDLALKEKKKSEKQKAKLLKGADRNSRARLRVGAVQYGMVKFDEQGRGNGG